MSQPPDHPNSGGLVRCCKAALVAMMALFFGLVAFGNLSDYGSNWAFVQHVLAMDSIFTDSTLRWRAITDVRLQQAGYAAIIAWQSLTCLILVVATTRLFLAARRPAAFRASKPLAVLGLTMGLLLYGVGFTVIGGEWFAMWQSHSWNGLDSAAHFVLLDGIVLLFIINNDH